MQINKFIEELRKINIDINENQLNQLNMYYELLIEWNQKINLTGITDKAEVYLKHFYDSATLNKIIDLSKLESLCDVGTGAGFPGIVLKILFPNIKVVLLDSLNKRLLFLNEVIKKLKLKDISTVHCRAEEYGVNHREEFDVVTARAVAPLNILSEYCIPMVKVGKNFIAMKSNISQEIINIDNVLKKLDSTIESIIEFQLPVENSKRTLISIKKNKPTNKNFPRKFSDIKNRPLV